MFKKFKNFNPIWLIPIAIIISIFIAVTAWFATDGNVIFIFIGNGLIYVFAFLVFIVYPSHSIYSLLSIRRITKRELKKAGIDWEKVKTILIENRWASEVFITYDGISNTIPGEIHLTVDPESQKEELRSVLGFQYDYLSPILRRNWKKLLSDKQRRVISYGIMVVFWGLLTVAIQILATPRK